MRIYCREQTNGGGRLIWEVIMVVKVKERGPIRQKTVGVVRSGQADNLPGRFF